MGFHPLSSTFIHFHPLSSTLIHFLPTTSNFIPFHSITSNYIQFYPISSTFIHIHSLSLIFILVWSVKAILNRLEQSNLYVDGTGSLNGLTIRAPNGANKKSNQEDKIHSVSFSDSCPYMLLIQETRNDSREIC